MLVASQKDSSLHLYSGGRGSSIIKLAGAPIPVFILGDRPDRREYTRHWTPVHLDFVVADLRAATDRARDAGAAIEKEVEHETFAMSSCAP